MCSLKGQNGGRGHCPGKGEEWWLLTGAGSQGERPKCSWKGTYEPAGILKRNLTMSKMNSGRGKAVPGRSRHKQGHAGTERSDSGVLQAQPQGSPANRSEDVMRTGPTSQAVGRGARHSQTGEASGKNQGFALDVVCTKFVSTNQAMW